MCTCTHVHVFTQLHIYSHLHSHSFLYTLQINSTTLQSFALTLTNLRTSHTITHTVTSMEQFNMAFRAQQPTLRGKMEAVRDLLEPQPQIGGRPNARPKEGNGLGKA